MNRLSAVARPRIRPPHSPCTISARLIHGSRTACAPRSQPDPPPPPTSEPYLTHIWLGADPKHRIVPVKYADAVRLQDDLRETLLSWKRCSDTSTSTSTTTSSSVPPPLPTVLSFVSRPTYTLGRRQKILSSADRARLTQPLRQSPPDENGAPKETNYIPEIVESSRGGLTTYHGPGQLVLWPVLDLHSPLHRHFSVRDYTRLLEETTQACLLRIYELATFLDCDEPGVWTGSKDNNTDQNGARPAKISAVGIHLRRYVTGLGVSVNLDVPVVGDEAVNPWARFVPCGIEDRDVTSVAALAGTGTAAQGEGKRDGGHMTPLHMERFAGSWAAELSERLGLAGRVYTSPAMPVAESAVGRVDN